MKERAVRVVNIDCMWKLRMQHPSRFLVRIERQGKEFIVSPLLGEELLCERCWILRRIATLNPSQLCPTASSATDLIKAFQQKNAVADRPKVPVQRTQIAQILRSRIRDAKTTSNIFFPPFLSRVTESGAVHSEPVLPLPDCEYCSKGVTCASPGQLSYVVGASAGIIADLQEVPSLEGEPLFPHVVVSRLANTFLDPNRPFWAGASGKGVVRDTAYGTAISETLERYAAGIISRPLVIAHYSELDSAIHPRRLTGVEASQAKEAGYDEDGNIAWIQGTSIYDPTQTVWLPASAVYLHLPLQFREQLAVPFVSNGLACASTLKEAIDRGYTEVIERHTFFSVWYGIQEPELLNADSFLDDLTVIDSFKASGLELRTMVLGTHKDGVVAAASCWANNSLLQRPGFTIGLGNGKEPETAVRGAVLEAAQVYRGLTWALQDASLQKRAESLKHEPSMVSEPYDHALLFSSRTPETVPSPFGLAPPRKVSVTQTSKPINEAFFVDLTPRDLARATRWSVVRVVVPDLIPFHFGTTMIPRFLLNLPPTETSSTELLHPLS